MSFRRILVATDFSPCARPALERAVELCRAVAGHLHLLYVSQVPDVLAGEAVALNERFIDADLKEGRAAIEREVGGLRQRGIEADGEVRTGFAADVIIEEAKPARFDLIVLGTHGRKGLRHLWLGSVAERVVRSAAIPVLTVRSES